VLVAFTVFLSACGGPDPVSSAPEEWRVFKGDGISLSLPDVLAPGAEVSTTTSLNAVEYQDAASETTTAGGQQLFEVFRIWMNPYFRSLYMPPDYVFFLTNGTGSLGSLPRVMAMRDVWDYQSYEGDLNIYVELHLRNLQPPPLSDKFTPSVEVIWQTAVSPERIDLEVRIPGADGLRPPVMGYWTIRKARESVYFVIYEADEGSFAALESFFRTSADTIVVQEP
jgi:hypothetical protein